jgi:putative sigma-54 modulation protein
MNIIVTGRHLNVSDSLRDYAGKKIKKLDHYFNQLLDAHVILTVEKLDHISEVVINGDGVQFHGKEKAADFFSSIDLLLEKMEKQIHRYKEKHQAHKGPEKSEAPTFDITGSEGKQIILRQVNNKPIDNVEALLQMRVDKKEFILFKKGASKIEPDLAPVNRNYAVIYRDLTGLKMVEVPVQKTGIGSAGDRYVVYDLNILDDSPTSPKIEFKKNKTSGLLEMTLNEAIQEIDKSKNRFLPFYNTESQFINVVYKDGNKYEVMVPAF